MKHEERMYEYMATRSNLRDGRKTVQRGNNWAARFNAPVRTNVRRDVNERALRFLFVPNAFREFYAH